MYFSLSAKTQIDYIQLSEELNIECSDNLLDAKHLSDSLSNFKIGNGKEQFLYDRGMTYYKLFGKDKKQDDFQTAKTAFESCWNEFQNLTAMWNLALLEYFNNNCEQALQNIDLFIDSMPEDSVDRYMYKEAYELYKDCKKKN